MARILVFTFTLVAMLTMVAPIAARQRGAGPGFVDANNDGICDHHPGDGRGGPHHSAGACAWCGFGAGGASLVDIAATTLGLDKSAVVTELGGNKSLSQVMEAHGRTAQDLVDAVVLDRKPAIDKAVADGRLTSADAEQTVARMRAHAQQMISAPWTSGGRSAGTDCPWGGGPGHHRHGHR